MKSCISLLAGLSALASQTSAHYIFQRLTHAGTLYPAYTYIRTNTNNNSPVIDLTSNDLRCNVGGETAGSTTTLTVKAGDAFTITSDVAVYHNGPLSIYMAKAPSTAAAFDGSGQVWFKILDLGPVFNADGSVTWPLSQSYSYTIPPALPSGDYLLRIQQLGIHNPYPGGIPQFYISCAQLSVTNGGSGTPGPLVSIPGFIKGTEPGYVVNIYTNFNNYTVPGPAVWSGQNVGGGGGGGGTTTSVAAPTSTTSSSVKVTSTTSSSVKTSTTTLKTTSTSSTAPAGTGAPVPKYGQCGGQGWAGSTVCVAGSTCTAQSQYYSQCT